jgi:hypothetical protein
LQNKGDRTLLRGSYVMIRSQALLHAYLAKRDDRCQKSVQRCLSTTALNGG